MRWWRRQWLWQHRWDRPRVGRGRKKAKLGRVGSKGVEGGAVGRGHGGGCRGTLRGRRRRRLRGTGAGEKRCVRVRDETWWRRGAVSGAIW